MGKMYLAKEETSQQILNTVENLSFSGGGYGVELAPVINAVATNGNLKNFIKWKDPADCVVDGATLSRWAGTKVVRKVGSAPTSPTDGEVILDNKERGAYEITPYEDAGLTANTEYFYAFFPYNTKGVHTLVDFPTVNAMPTNDRSPATMTAHRDTLKLYKFKDLPKYRSKNTVNITTNSDGNIVAFSDNEDVAIVEVNGTTLTITSVNADVAHIVVSQHAGSDYNSPADKTITVTVVDYAQPEFVNNLEVCSWDFVQEAVRAGLADTLWDVGDKIAVRLNGDLKTANDTVGKRFNDDVYFATVLGFNHNKTFESPDTNSMHFIIGKKANVVKLENGDYEVEDIYDIAFPGFQMNTANANTGGWKDSQMRTVTCPSFYECLPADLKAVIGTVTKYSDNVGGGSAYSDNMGGSWQNPSTDMSATQDKIFLLSEYEVHGKKTYANDNEQHYQRQYEYYANGNSKIRYNADAMGTAVNWWCRSAYTISENNFGHVDTSGSAKSYSASTAYGFAPGFAIIA